MSALFSHRSLDQGCTQDLYIFGTSATNLVDQYKCPVPKVSCVDFTLLILWYFFLNVAIVFRLGGS